MKALTRKEAIMMGVEGVTPKSREEAILAGTPNLKAFTKDEQLRMNNYIRRDPSISDTLVPDDDEVPVTPPVDPSPI